MPSINTSIAILALMAVSPFVDALPQAQAASSSAAAKSSAAAVASSAAIASNAVKSTSVIVSSVVPSSSSKSSVSPSSAATVKSTSSAVTSSVTVVKSSIASASSNVVASTSASKVITTSAAVATPSGIAINAGSTDANALLKLHNDFRTHYGAAGLTWDNDLAAYAQKASNICKFAHTGGPNGENLAAGAGGGFNYTTGFNLWAQESSQYNWNSPGFSSATGHFTQVVWKATTKVGCGVTQCPDGTIFTGYGPSTFLVCEYQTPGNIVGNNNQYFKDNVGTYR